MESGWLPMGGKEPAAAVVSDQQPTISARIFEGRHCFDDFLRCTGKNDLAVALLQLADWDGDVMLADTQESAGADDGVGDRLSGAMMMSSAFPIASPLSL